MKREELLTLKELINNEQERRERIKELLNNDLVKEYLKLANIDPLNLNPLNIKEIVKLVLIILKLLNQMVFMYVLMLIILKHVRVIKIPIINEFENDNLVLNPKNSNKNMNGYDDVRLDFFENAFYYGQAKSKQLLLKKYKRL